MPNLPNIDNGFDDTTPDVLPAPPPPPQPEPQSAPPQGQVPMALGEAGAARAAAHAQKQAQVGELLKARNVAALQEASQGVRGRPAIRRVPQIPLAPPEPDPQPAAPPVVDGYPVIAERAAERTMKKAEQARRWSEQARDAQSRQVWADRADRLEQQAADAAAMASDGPEMLEGMPELTQQQAAELPENQMDQIASAMLNARRQRAAADRERAGDVPGRGRADILDDAGFTEAAERERRVHREGVDHDRLDAAQESADRFERRTAEMVTEREKPEEEPEPELTVAQKAGRTLAERRRKERETQWHRDQASDRFRRMARQAPAAGDPTGRQLEDDAIDAPQPEGRHFRDIVAEMPEAEDPRVVSMPDEDQRKYLDQIDRWEKDAKAAAAAGGDIPPRPPTPTAHLEATPHYQQAFRDTSAEADVVLESLAKSQGLDLEQAKKLPQYQEWLQDAHVSGLYAAEHGIENLERAKEAFNTVLEEAIERGHDGKRAREYIARHLESRFADVDVPESWLDSSRIPESGVIRAAVDRGIDLADESMRGAARMTGMLIGQGIQLGGAAAEWAFEPDIVKEIARGYQHIGRDIVDDVQENIPRSRRAEEPWTVDWYAASLGEQVPIFATLFVGAGLGNLAGNALARAGIIGERGVRVTQRLSSMGSVGSAYASSYYDRAYRDFRERGLSDDEARERALAGSAVVGVGTAIAAAIPYQRWIQQQPGRVSRLRGAITGLAAEASSEAIQETVVVLGEIYQEIGDTGFDWESIDRVLQSASVAGGVGAIAGAARAGGRSQQPDQSDQAAADHVRQSLLDIAERENINVPEGESTHKILHRVVRSYPGRTGEQMRRDLEPMSEFRDAARSPEREMSRRRFTPTQEATDAPRPMLEGRTERPAQTQAVPQLEGPDLPSARPPAQERQALPEPSREPTDTAPEGAAGVDAESSAGPVSGVARVSPDQLQFREDQQVGLEEVARRFPADMDAGDLPPIVAIQAEDGLHIVDGHHRATVWQEQGRPDVPVVSIRQDAYDHLKDQGFDDTEISAAALIEANQHEHAASIEQQFSGADIIGRSVEALRVLDRYDADGGITEATPPVDATETAPDAPQTAPQRTDDPQQPTREQLEQMSPREVATMARKMGLKATRDKAANVQRILGEQGQAPAPPATGAGVMAERQESARDRFVESTVEQFGLTQQQAEAALDRLMADKVVKLNPATGQFDLRDGRFWDRDVMLRAAGEGEVDTQPTQHTRESLEPMRHAKDLVPIARELGVKPAKKKAETISRILEAQGVAEPQAEASPEPPANAAQWWNRELTPEGRRRVMKAAGIRKPDRVLWDNLRSDDRKRLLAKHEAADDAPASEPQAVDAPTETDAAVSAILEGAAEEFGVTAEADIASEQTVEQLEAAEAAIHAQQPKSLPKARHGDLAAMSRHMDARREWARRYRAAVKATEAAREREAAADPQPEAQSEPSGAYEVPQDAWLDMIDEAEGRTPERPKQPRRPRQRPTQGKADKARQEFSDAIKEFGDLLDGRLGSNQVLDPVILKASGKLIAKGVKAGFHTFNEVVGQVYTALSGAFGESRATQIMDAAADAIEQAWPQIQKMDPSGQMGDVGTVSEAMATIQQEANDAAGLQEDAGRSEEAAPQRGGRDSSTQSDVGDGDRGVAAAGAGVGEGDGGRGAASSGRDSGSRPGQRSVRGDGQRGDRPVGGEPEGSRTGDSQSRRDGPPTRAASANHIIRDVKAIVPPSGLKGKVRSNIAAIETVIKIEEEGRGATADEQAVMARYGGWGNVSQVFNEYSEAGRSLEKERAKLKRLLSAEEYAAARHSTENAHYTDPMVIQEMWRGMLRMGFEGGRVIEPAVGIGHFIGLMPEQVRHSKTLAIELDNMSGRMARALYPNADVQIKGFQEVPLPDNYADAYITNVPFSEVAVGSDPRYSKLNPALHNYYFLKMIDSVRPGGIVAAITSKGTLDNPNAEGIRRILASNADLISAVRFPGGAFGKIAGTEVVADLLILQKRMPGKKPSDVAWAKTVPHEVADGKPVYINEYFEANPDQVMGTIDRTGTMYRGGEMNVTAHRNWQKKFSDAIDRLPEGIVTKRDHTTKAHKPQPIPAPGEVKNNSFAVKDGKVYRRQGNELVPQKLSKDQRERVIGMLGVRDRLRDVFRAELSDAPAKEVEAARKALNKTYDAFVKKHGKLGDRKNAKLLEPDPESYVVMALEQGADREKAPVFSQRTLRPDRKVDRVESVGDAIPVVLNESARVDVPRIAELTGKTEEQVANDLTSEGLAYQNPEGGWETATEYLSGNVKAKLNAARAAADIDPVYQPNVDALVKVQPEDVPVTDIDVRIGAPWVTPGVVEEFSQSLDLPGFAPDIFFNETTGGWSVRGASNRPSSNPAYTRYETKRVGIGRILENALNNTAITVKDKDADGNVVPNHQESTEANLRVSEIQQQFKDWVWTDDARREHLHRRYNDTFNNIAMPKYDGSHLEFPGMVQEIKATQFKGLREHQSNMVWRGIVRGRGIMAHGVGAGKTFVFGAIAMERKRLGLSSKPAMAVPKALVTQTTAEIRTLYPAARIISMDEVKNAKDRKTLTAQIATGDWDLVIVTHPAMDRMALQPETQRQFLQEELAELEETLAIAQEAEGGRSPSVKDMEKRKDRLTEKINKLLSEAPKDDAVYFDELGIDFLMVDEAHKYKALPIYTKHGTLKGIPKSSSARAQMFNMIARTLIDQNNGAGLILGTGTVLENSMAELYNFQRYVQYHDMKKAGVHSFDAWAQTFGEIQTRVEFTHTGAIKPVTSFSSFSNINQLYAMVMMDMDVVHAKEVQDIKLPERKDNVVGVDETETQKLWRFLTMYRVMELPKGRPEAGSDNHVTITTDGTKAAIDMRLVLPGMKDDPGSKLNRVVEDVVRLMEENPGTTQFIFSDQGVNPTEWGFSAYDEIIAKLVKNGVPADKIIDARQFNDTAKGKKLRREANDRLNAGDALVAIGSTDKLGTGVNAQRLAVAAHHLDAPWFPGSVVQRNGRVLRQGNKHREWGKPVFVRTYVTSQSQDAFKWTLIDRKQSNFDQFMSGTLTNKVDEQSVDEMTPDQIMAVASGNPKLMRKIEVDFEVKKLRQQKRSHDQKIIDARDAVNRAKSEIQRIEATQKAIRSVREAYEAAREAGGESIEITFDGTTHTKDAAKKLNQYMADLSQQAFEKRRNPLRGEFTVAAIKFGEFYGLDLRAQYHFSSRTLEFKVYPPQGSGFDTVGDIRVTEKPGQQLRSLEAEARHVVSDRAYLRMVRKDLEAGLESASKQTDTPFAKQEELDNLTEQQADLDRELQGVKMPERIEDLGLSSEDAATLKEWFDARMQILQRNAEARAEQRVKKSAREADLHRMASRREGGFVNIEPLVASIDAAIRTGQWTTARMQDAARWIAEASGYAIETAGQSLRRLADRFGPSVRKAFKGIWRHLRAIQRTEAGSFMPNPRDTRAARGLGVQIGLRALRASGEAPQRVSAAALQDAADSVLQSFPADQRESVYVHMDRGKQAARQFLSMVRREGSVDRALWLFDLRTPPAGPTTKQRVKQATEQPRQEPTVTEREAMEASMKAQRRAATQADREARREERASARQKIAEVREKVAQERVKARERLAQAKEDANKRLEAQKENRRQAEAIRKELARVVTDRLPTEIRGQFITAVRDGTSFKKLLEGVRRVEAAFRKYDHAKAVQRYRDLLSKAKKTKFRPEFRRAMESLVADIDASKMSDRTKHRLEALAEHLAQNPTAEIPSYVADGISRLAKSQLADMDAADVHALADSLENIIHLNNLKGSMIGRQKARTQKAVAAAALQEMIDRVPELKRKKGWMSGTEKKAERSWLKRLMLEAGTRPEVIIEHLSPTLQEIIYEDVVIQGYHEEQGKVWAMRDALKAQIKRSTDLDMDSRAFDSWRQRKMTLQTPEGEVQILRDEAIWLYTSTLDPSNLAFMRKRGVTLDRSDRTFSFDDATMDAVKELIGKEGMEIANFYHRQFNTTMKDHLNKAWVEVFGHEIARVPSYVPRSIDLSRGDTKQDPMAQMQGDIEATIESYSHLRERVGTGSPLRIGNATDGFLNHAEHVARISSYLAPATNAYAILGREEVKQAILRRLGKSGYDRILASINMQTVRHADRFGGEAEVRDLMRKSGASILALRLSPMLLQGTGLPIAASYYEGGFADLSAAITTVSVDPMRSWREAHAILEANSPGYRTRYNQFSRQVTSGLAGDGKRYGSRGWEEYGLDPLQWTDKVGATIRFNMAERYLARTRPELEKGTDAYNQEVSREWERMMYRSENTGHGGDMTGAIALGRRNIFFGAFVKFTSSTSKIYSAGARGVLAAQRARHMKPGKERTKAIRTATASFSALAVSSAFAGLMREVIQKLRGNEDEDEAMAKRVGRRMAGEMTSLIPVLGDVIAPAVSTALGDPKIAYNPNLLASVMQDGGRVLASGASAANSALKGELDASGEEAYLGKLTRALDGTMELVAMRYGLPYSGPKDIYRMSQNIAKQAGIAEIESDEIRREFQASIQQEDVTQDRRQVYRAIARHDVVMLEQALDAMAEKGEVWGGSNVVSSVDRRYAWLNRWRWVQRIDQMDDEQIKGRLERMGVDPEFLTDLRIERVKMEFEERDAMRESARELVREWRSRQ